MTAAARAHRHRKWLPYAAALVAVATLGACTGGDPAPAPTTPSVTSATATTTTSAPPTTATPTTTTTVDPVVARIPAPARAHTQAGAEAFAKFYMEQVNAAFTKADPAALMNLASASCKTCASFLAGARDLKAKGIHHEGVSITVDGAPANSYSAEKAVIQLFVSQHSVPVVNGAGKKVDQTKAGDGILVATLSFDSRWIVERLQVAK